MMVVHTVGMLRLAVEVRSGLKEGIDVAFHIRKPIEPFEIDDRLRRDFGPLFEAWSHIWVIGSQEAIKKANRLLDSAVTVLGAGTTRGEELRVRLSPFPPLLNRLLGLAVLLT
jgi:hypothetical protein